MSADDLYENKLWRLHPNNENINRAMNLWTCWHSWTDELKKNNEKEYSWHHGGSNDYFIPF